MADPTLRILATLDDPELYVRESGVPVFVPHVRRDEDGEVEVEVTPEDLQQIAGEMQRKLEEYGTLVRVTRGHVVLPKPDSPPPPEDEQPPIWGWAKNPRVGEWGPERKPGLLVDIYFQRGKHDEAMGYPFRSAEYYPETNEITGIALLRRDPELDMGLLTYARRDTPEQGKPEVTMPNPEDDFLDDETGGQEQYADDPDGLEDGPEGDEYSPEEAEQYARMHRYNAKRAEDLLAEMGDDDEDRPHMEQLARCYGRMAYGAGEPAGGNAFVPGDDLDDEPPMAPLGDEEDPMEQYGSDHLRGDNQSGQMAAIGAKGDAKKKEKKATKEKVNKRVSQAAYARQGATQRQYARLEHDIQELKKGRAMLQYERHLDQLDRQGVIFDMGEELKDAAEMTPEQRLRHLKKMAKHYARSPVGGGLISTDFDDVENNRQRPLTREQKAAAVRYSQRNGVTYEQAMIWARQNA